MTTLGFYGSRRPSGSSSRTNTPTSAESDGVLNTKVDQLLSLVEKLQRDQRQLHQSIVTLTERVDCLCESTERLQAVQASESNSKRGQKKIAYHFECKSVSRLEEGKQFKGDEG